VSPIKDLLKYRITTKKICICVKEYVSVGKKECYFKMSPEYMESWKRNSRLVLDPFYECDMDSYPIAVLIKYKKSSLQNPVTLIEMIELLALVTISFCSFIDRRVVIENVCTDKYN